MVTSADLYHYRVIQFLGNYDGDTIDVMIDLGLRTYVKMRLRLRGIDTPELRGETYDKGRIARDYVTSRLETAASIMVRTHKDRTGKYGRWIADVFVNGTSLNDELVAMGLAVRYDES